MSNDDKNNNNKRPRNPNDIVNTTIIKRKPIIYYNEDDEELLNQLLEQQEKEYEKTRLEKEKIKLEQEKNLLEQEKELITLNVEVNSLSDLIDLGNLYNPTKRYNINLEQLNNMVPSLIELNEMIGMKKVKNDIIEHILFYLQKLDDSNIDMLHTVIEGPPGVGKTELGKILGKIYLSMGILKNKTFKKVSRSDMVAKYLGQTAIKTDELIQSCKGGVMFIDEVYSLGSREMRDSFSKEAIDTLNMKLSEMKNEFICIIAGYRREIEECFFSYNVGLKSRFPIRFTIDPYTPRELFQIYKLIVKENNWELDKSVKLSFFKKNYDEFKYYGRDMELLFTKCKRAHSKRIFNDSNAVRKTITSNDLNVALKNFLLNK